MKKEEFEDTILAICIIALIVVFIFSIVKIILF